MRLAQSRFFCHIGDRNLFHIIIFYIFNNEFHFLQRLPVLERSLGGAALGKQNVEHQKKLRLDGKLIGLWIGLTDLIRTVHAGSDRRVIGVIRLKERRNGQPAIQKRLEIIT